MELNETRYAIVRELPALTYDIAVEVVKEELAAQGFGILSEIDVRATLKKKLDEDFRPYVILGACNPEMAHRAFSSEPLIGVFLPCNVVVMERDGGGVVVAAMDPEVAFELVDNDEVRPVAAKVGELLTAALRRL